MEFKKRGPAGDTTPAYAAGCLEGTSDGGRYAQPRRRYALRNVALKGCGMGSGSRGQRTRTKRGEPVQEDHRDIQFAVRLSRDERAAIRNRAGTVSMAHYMREAALSGTATVDTESIGRAVSRIGATLHCILARFDARDETSLATISEINDALADLRVALHEIGRALWQDNVAP
jgi:hypothetical protein